MSGVPEITAQELAAEKAGNPGLFLLDVREQNEADLCQIPGSMLIPLNHLPLRFEEVPKDAEVVVYCHHGRRSERAIQFLQHQGFDRLRNLVGGIHAWAEEIDPDMARY